MSVWSEWATPAGWLRLARWPTSTTRAATLMGQCLPVEIKCKWISQRKMLVVIGQCSHMVYHGWCWATFLGA